MKTPRRTGGAVVVVMAMAGAMIGVVAMGAAAAVPAEPHTVSGEWQVDLRKVLSVGGVVLGGVVWLSRVIQRFEDRLGEGGERFERMEARLGRMEERLEQLPCKSTEECLGSRKRVES